MIPILRTLDSRSDEMLVDENSLIWASVPLCHPHRAEVITRIRAALDHDFVEKKPFTAIITLADCPNRPPQLLYVTCDPKRVEECVRAQFTTPAAVMVHFTFPGHIHKEVL